MKRTLTTLGTASVITALTFSLVSFAGAQTASSTTNTTGATSNTTGADVMYQHHERLIQGLPNTGAGWRSCN